MNFGIYLSRFEVELKEKVDTYIEVEKSLFKDVTLCNTQNIHDFMIKKIEMEKAKQKYYAFKSLIYRNNINLETKISMMIIEEYEDKYSI